MEERDNTETSLQRHRTSKNRRAGKCASRAPRIVCMPYRQKPDCISDQAVLELNRERVFKKIAPGRLKEP